MKVLPCHQPWASLIVLGKKRVETRPRPTPFSMKGRVAVHANKTEESVGLVKFPVYAEALAGHELQFGHIIGTVEIVRSVTITEEVSRWQEKNRRTEYAFGDYTPGRFGWVLRGPILLREPIPFTAHQGWPDIDDELIPEYAR